MPPVRASISAIPMERVFSSILRDAANAEGIFSSIWARSRAAGFSGKSYFVFYSLKKIKIVPQARRVVKWPRSGLDGGLRSRRFRSFFAFVPGRSCLAERLAAEKFRDTRPLSGLDVPTLRQHDSGRQRG